MSTQTLAPEVNLPVASTNSEQPTPSPTKRPTLRILQPEVTYTGAPIKPLLKGLPKQTESLCPECIKVIPANIFADGGKVVMEKRCPEHGHFRDIVFSDVDLYHQDGRVELRRQPRPLESAGRRRREMP
jgi:hypothetical protein